MAHHISGTEPPTVYLCQFCPCCGRERYIMISPRNEFPLCQECRLKHPKVFSREEYPVCPQ